MSEVKQTANMTDQETEQRGWWRRLSGGLKRTSASIGGAIADLVTKRKLDQTMLDEIEEVLIRADLGIDVAAKVANAVGEGRYDQAITPDEVKAVVAAEVEKIMTPVAKPLAIGRNKPFVVLVVGVNGSGKTTTIGKLAARLRAEGRSVMLAAGDTFRAAAIDQLKIWGERTGDRARARRRCRGARVRSAVRRPRARNRRADRRHRGTAAEQGRPHGRAG